MTSVGVAVIAISYLHEYKTWDKVPPDQQVKALALVAALPDAPCSETHIVGVGAAERGADGKVRVCLLTKEANEHAVRSGAYVQRAGGL